MKRLVLILFIGLVAAVLCFILLPGPRTAGGVESRSSAGKLSRTPAENPVRPVSDPEILQLEAARREAEQKVEMLQSKLAEAEAAKAVRAKAKKPFADPEMRKVMTAEAASGVERSAKALLDAGLAEELQLNEEQRKALQDLLVERGAIGWNQILIPMAAGELKGERLATAGRLVREAYARN